MTPLVQAAVTVFAIYGATCFVAVLAFLWLTFCDLRGQDISRGPRL